MDQKIEMLQKNALQIAENKMNFYKGTKEEDKIVQAWHKKSALTMYFLEFLETSTLKAYI